MLVEVIFEPNDDGLCVFHPGETLKGAVKLNLNRSKEFRVFYIVIEGKANFSYTMGRTTYNNKIIYLDSKKLLIGDGSGDRERIGEGTRIYNFECELPSLLPESFTSNIGSIKYYVRAVFKTALEGEKLKFPFTITRKPANPAPKTEVAEEFIFNRCKVYVTLSDGIKYSAGEIIPIKIEYNNQNSDNITRTKIKLKCYTTYTSTRNFKKVDPENLVEIYSGGVQSGNSDVFFTRFAVPPSALRSNEQYCDIITISYALKIECITDSFLANHKISIPITIV